MNILYILIAVVILGIIVMIHEFGHYLAGRLCGMTILEFSVGFGPKLLGFEKEGIKYSVRLIPLGGYCMFEGENEKTDDPKAMCNQPVWKRLITVAAGPFMNMVLALLCAMGVVFGYGSTEGAPVITEVMADTPAYTAGLEAGDRITKVNGLEISYDEAGLAELIEEIRDSGGEEIAISVDRGGTAVDLVLTPAYVEEANAYQVGVLLGYKTIRYGLGEGIGMAFRYVVYVGRLTLEGLRTIFTSREALDQVTGPVGIIDVISTSVQQGFDMVLYLGVLISLNLGIVNLLPIPGLDGGRLLFLIVEAIRRKPVDQNKEGLVHAAGLILLFGFILFVTYKDIVRLITGG